MNSFKGSCSRGRKGWEQAVHALRMASPTMYSGSCSGVTKNAAKESSLSPYDTGTLHISFRKTAEACEELNYVSASVVHSVALSASASDHQSAREKTRRQQDSKRT